LDAAGKYWILTEPTTDRIKKCVAIYEKSVNYSGYQILQDIVFRGDKSQLSPYVKNKLTELELSSKEKVNHIPKFQPKRNKKHKDKSKKMSFRDQLTQYFIGGILIGLAACLLIGIVTVFKWIF
jgi:hypothetical protein